MVRTYLLFDARRGRRAADKLKHLTLTFGVEVITGDAEDGPMEKSDERAGRQYCFGTPGSTREREESGQDKGTR